MDRRRFLAATVPAGLAGCLDDCAVGETWAGVAASLADATAHRTDGGWRFEATLVVDFNFARSDGLGVEDAGVRLYGPDRTAIATERIGDVT